MKNVVYYQYEPRRTKGRKREAMTLRPMSETQMNLMTSNSFFFFIRIRKVIRNKACLRLVAPGSTPILPPFPSSVHEAAF
jgi:hypothetical protein